MSRQSSSDMPIPGRAPAVGRTRSRGRFELWQRFVGSPKFVGQNLEWFRIRRYATRELAEQNCIAMIRKWNSWPGNDISWAFEVREVLE